MAAVQLGSQAAGQEFGVKRRREAKRRRDAYDATLRSEVRSETHVDCELMKHGFDQLCTELGRRKPHIDVS